MTDLEPVQGLSAGENGTPAGKEGVYAFTVICGEAGLLLKLRFQIQLLGEGPVPYSA